MEVSGSFSNVWQQYIVLWGIHAIKFLWDHSLHQNTFSLFLPKYSLIHQISLSISSSRVIVIILAQCLIHLCFHPLNYFLYHMDSLKAKFNIWSSWYTRPITILLNFVGVFCVWPFSDFYFSSASNFSFIWLTSVCWLKHLEQTFLNFLPTVAL